MDIHTIDENINIQEELNITKYPPTGDKVYEQNILKYSEDPDNVNFNEEIFIIDKNLNNTINKYTPSIVNSSNNWSIISTLLSFLATKIFSTSTNLVNVYSVYDLIVNEEKVKKLAEMFNIDYPADYPIDQLALLVRVWPKIYDKRGEEASLKMLYKVLERSEKDLYNDDFDDTVITQTSYGNFNIIYNSRIKNIEFAKYLTKKLLPAGRGFQLSTQSYIREYSSSGLTYIYNESPGYAMSDEETSLLDTITMTLDSGESVFLVYEIGDVVGYPDY